MTDHDPMCPGMTNECICVSLRRARKDERGRVAAEAAGMMRTNELLIRADERERIAQAIDDWPTVGYANDYADDMMWIPQVTAARIARDPALRAGNA